jgi:hypothetical protein
MTLYSWRHSTVAEQVANLRAFHSCTPPMPACLLPGFLDQWLQALERSCAAGEAVILARTRPIASTSYLSALHRLIASPGAPAWSRLFLVIFLSTGWRAQDIPHARDLGDRIVVDRHKALHGRNPRRRRPIIFLKPATPLWNFSQDVWVQLSTHTTDYADCLDRLLRPLGFRWRSRNVRNGILPALAALDTAQAQQALSGHGSSQMLHTVYARNVLHPAEEALQRRLHSLAPVPRPSSSGSTGPCTEATASPPRLLPPAKRARPS